MIDLADILLALGLTLVAGLSTGIGALVSFMTKATNTRVLSVSLGLSAGVMIYISFMELLPESVSALDVDYAPRIGALIATLAFFAGIALIAIIDRFVPEDENPHEMHSLDELQRPDNHHLKRTGIMLALAIGIHNFPEGMATFVSALDNMQVAIPVVIAIAIHNIPEGIAVSVPIYQATGNRSKAMRMSLLSGLAEPVGALVGMAVLMPLWTPLVKAISLSVVAGIMVYISFDELLPGSERYGHHHQAIGGVIAGMALMAATLIVL